MDTKKNVYSVSLAALLTAASCFAQSAVAPLGTPLSFEVPPHALSAISFSTSPNAQCSLTPARSSSSGHALTVFANDEGTATFYVTPSQESSSAAELVATCSSGTQQTIQIQPVAGAKPLARQAASNAATQLSFGHTARPAVTGDPMALSNQELVKRGYPLRPDPQQSPGAYSNWLRAVSKPATFIPPKTVNVEGRYHGPAKVSADPGRSNNWSGYALYGASSPFDWVEGDWNVPALMDAEVGTTTHSSYWIGLDGWGSSDVVQDGTNQDVSFSDGNLYYSYWPWTEICCQEPETAISNFSVSPGDEIFSEVWMGDSNGYLNPNGGFGYFWFEDVTTGQYTYLSTQFNSGTFTGISAEWIMERPTFSFGLPDLSDYWYALMRDPWAYTGDNTWVNYLNGGDGATSYQLTMYNGNDALSTVYPINSNEMEFIWLKYH